VLNFSDMFETRVSENDGRSGTIGNRLGQSSNPPLLSRDPVDREASQRATQIVRGSELQKTHDLVEDSKIVAPLLAVDSQVAIEPEPRNRGRQRDWDLFLICVVDPKVITECDCPVTATYSW